MSRQITVLGVLSVLVMAVIVIMSGASSPVEAASPDTLQVTRTLATPTPTLAPGWTIQSRTFESNYPKGFKLSIEATGPGGKIVEANVAWSHAPGYMKRATGKVNSTGVFTATWNADRNDATPPWVGVDYWWTLKDEAGNVYQTPHILEEYADKSRKWSRAESDDVIVIWQQGVPDSVGQATIKAMKEQRDFYKRNWGQLLNYKPRAIIFATRQDYASWNPDITTVVGGVAVFGTTQGSWGATVQIYFNRRPASYTAYSIVLHEVAHLYQYATGGIIQGTDWFVEGNATYFELTKQFSPDPDLPECVVQSQARARSGEFPSLQGEGPSTRGADALDGYEIGCAFFYWLEETYGPDAHRKLWQLVGRGTSRSDALEQVTGLKFPDMDTEFRKWIGLDNPVAPTPVVLPTLEFPPTRAPRPTRTPRP